MEGNIKLVLFDIDDTLYDFQTNWDEAVRKTFASHALTREMDQKSVCETFNYYAELNWNKIARGEATFQQYRLLRMQDTMRNFGVPISEEQADSFNKAFIGMSLSLLQEDGFITEMIRRMAERCKLGVITNGAGDTAMEKLARLGLAAYFPEDAVFVSSVVGVSKPDPGIFRLALDRLGCRAEEALFVGDSWEADIVGALNAGLSAVWLNPKGAVPATGHRPNAVIEKLTDLESVLALLSR